MCSEVIICIGGIDPTGGAGLSADIVTIHALGGHACPIVSVQTQQTTVNVQAVVAQDLAFFKTQLCSLQNLPIKAIKIGLIAAEHVPIIKTFIENLKAPVVLDPILSAGGGYKFHQNGAILQPLMKHCHLTPNRAELDQLTHNGIDGECARQQLGCQSLIVTDESHQAQNAVSIYQPSGVEHLPYDKTLGDYHGTGCTFSSALTISLAQNGDVIASCQRALDHTQKAIQNAYTLGQGQSIPKRV